MLKILLFTLKSANVVGMIKLYSSIDVSSNELSCNALVGFHHLVLRDLGLVNKFKKSINYKEPHVKFQERAGTTMNRWTSSRS